MSNPRLLVEINGEAGGLFSILAKVQERLEAIQGSSSSSTDAARKSMGTLETGARAAAQALKVAEEELAAIRSKLAAGGGSGPDPAAAMARLTAAQAAYNRIQSQQMTAQQALGQASVMSYLRSAEATGTATRAVQAHTQATLQAERAQQGMSSSVFQAGAALMALRAALQGARQVLESVLNADLALEKAERTLQMATGDGAGAMAFVRQQAKGLGLELVTAADGYAQLAAASKGTAMEGKATEDVFRAISRASASMSLSGEQTHGIIIALGQMMSKGKVMSEELRRQLGNELPGAFNIAAKAMGVTTAELDKMLVAGKVISSDFLPKFANELELSLGDAPERAANSLQANINRIKTAFQGLSYEVGQGGAGASLSQALGELAAAINSPEGLQAVREMSRDLGQILLTGKDLALALWDLRGPILGLGTAWVAIKAGQIVKGLYDWGAAKVVVAQTTLAARNATIQEGLATQGLTLAKGQNAKAEVTKALAMLASQKATLANAEATGMLSAAETAALRESIALSEAKLAEAAAVTAAGRAGSAASATMAALGGPMGIALLAVGALAFAFTKLKDASLEEARAEGDRLARAAQDRGTTQGLIDDANHLNEILHSNTSTVDQKRRAQEQLQTVIQQLLVLSPDWANFLQKEGDLYLWNTEQVKKKTESDLAQAKAYQIKAQAAVEAAKAEVAANEAVLNSQHFAQLEAEKGGHLSTGWEGDSPLLRLWARLKSGGFDAALKERIDNLKAAGAAVQDLQKQLNALLTPTKPTKPTTPPEGPEEEGTLFTNEEITARLAGIKAAALEKGTLEQQKQLALDQAHVEYLKEDASLTKEASSEEGKFYGKQDQLNALVAANEQRLASKKLSIEQKYVTDRQKMAEDLQAKLTAGEEGGLTQRLEAVRRNFVAIREENTKLGNLHTEAEIKAAENAARERARQDQIRADLTKLRQQLTELAQIKGGPLTSGEMAEALNRFARSSDTAREAVAKLSNELHLNGTAAQGWAAGIREYIVNAQNTFQNWKNASLQILQGTENAFATTMQGILNGQLKGAAILKSIWTGITGAIIQALAQIAAKMLVAAIASKIFKDTTSDAAKEAAVSQQESAAATLWATYSGIPFVGPALAAGFIALMNASLVANAGAAQGIVGAAEGGWFDRPTMAVIGEGKRPELVVPDVAFRDFAANLSSNILAQERQAQGYGRAASGYASSAAVAQQAGPGAQQNGGTVLNLAIHNPTILDSSRRGLRNLGGMVIDGARAAARERSVVLVPGQVFGGL